MTNILMRCVNHPEYYSKILVFNKNKKIISNSLQQCVKQLVDLVRATSQLADVNKNLIRKKFDYIDKCILTHNWISKNIIEDIIDLIKTPYHINQTEVLSLIQWCNNEMDCSSLDKVNLVKSLWFTLTVCNFQLTINHYNALLKVYLENNHDFSPFDLLMEMKNKEIYPDSTTYNICINYYCMKGDINEAMLLLKLIHKPSFHSAESVFNSLLIGYSQLGNADCVNKLLNSMINKNIKLTTKSYTAVMCTYAKLNDICKIKEMIQVCHLNNMYFTNADILKVICVLAVNNHIESINTMYQYLKKMLHVSNQEIQFILELININQTGIAMRAFLHMTLDINVYSQFENALKIIIKHVIDESTILDKVIETCNWFNYATEIHKKTLSLSLYHSLLKSDHITLPLLRLCKCYFTIKPHYFWPLLIKNTTTYNLHGVLHILEIMTNEFHIPPCIYTVTDYVLPFFENIVSLRDLLIQRKISATVINNAWVLLQLKRLKPSKAAFYILSHPDQYFYKVLGHELRIASIIRNDVESFVNISYKLLEDTTYSTNTLSNSTNKSEPVSIDRQLHDTMIDFPYNKLWLKKVMHHLSTKNIKLKPETIKMMNNFLHEDIAHDDMYMLGNASNKMV